MGEKIGPRIVERRKQLKMSQSELSKVSGVCRGTLSALENGKCNDVLVGTLKALAEALQTTVDYFFA